MTEKKAKERVELLRGLNRITVAGEKILIFGNPYGFQLNIGNPYIKKLYEIYKKSIGCPTIYPLDDNQRIEFEKLTIDYLKKKFLKKEQK